MWEKSSHLTKAVLSNLEWSMSSTALRAWRIMTLLMRPSLSFDSMMPFSRSMPLQLMKVKST